MDGIAHEHSIHIHIFSSEFGEWRSGCGRKFSVHDEEFFIDHRFDGIGLLLAKFTICAIDLGPELGPCGGEGVIRARVYVDDDGHLIDGVADDEW